jgi:small neutral amino acid transporter SnatA (MarC family)
MDVAKLTVIIVGLTEVIKRVFNIQTGWLKVLITAVIAAGSTVLLYFLGDKADTIFTGLMAFSVATLSYDIIVKKLTEKGNV